MCIGISMVIKETVIEPYWIPGNNSHTDIRDKYGIPDGVGYPSLPVECIPTGVLTEPEAWEYRVDIQDTLPDWYTASAGEYEAACMRVCRRIVREIAEAGKYDGPLNLGGTPITSLGALTSVGGDLKLGGTPITSLGALTSVGGDLYLYGTPITSLGALTSVGGDLYLGGTPISQIDTGDIVKGIVYR